ncbi:cyclic lactone autoinducer peptide [Ruminiclostridium sufflavum DSM 19573]|uniref:Cyclic lactone autoinducer peptide n=1 Tax=Ruminiclostridium sufflavum DSM 19573 TaxID=1121337 RepID=A0A318XRE4_9FIRM|nr:cyclic lactone autoinducer peptide [Ruminiclostridium sufflavum]PYG88592.1 cyclic lactone autoinducer peptide [Ruminiclostridium sufflavum DSM 19573]
MIKRLLTNAIEKGIEEISIQRAGKCMLFIYQPKVPKVLRDKKAFKK